MIRLRRAGVVPTEREFRFRGRPVPRPQLIFDPHVRITDHASPRPAGVTGREGIGPDLVHAVMARRQAASGVMTPMGSDQDPIETPSAARPRRGQTDVWFLARVVAPPERHRCGAGLGRAGRYPSRHRPGPEAKPAVGSVRTTPPTAGEASRTGQLFRVKAPWALLVRPLLSSRLARAGAGRIPVVARRRVVVAEQSWPLRSPFFALPHRTAAEHRQLAGVRTGPGGPLVGVGEVGSARPRPENRTASRDSWKT